MIKNVCKSNFVILICKIENKFIKLKKYNLELFGYFF